MTTTLITGASSGLGLEFTKIAAKEGHNLVLVARRKQRLLELKKTLEKKYGLSVICIVQDLSKTQAAQSIYDVLKKKKITVDILINNAGFGGRTFFHKQDPKIQEEMIMVNVTALNILTRLIAADMVKKKSGKILNVASMAGFLPGPLQAVYYATKAYVVSLTEALSNELEGSGVTITALCPGPIATEFSSVAKVNHTKGFAHPANSREIAQFGYDAMMQGKIIAVPGFFHRVLIFMLRFLPRSKILKASRDRMEKL